MTCPRCGGALETGPRDFGSEQSGVAVVITGVPAGRCAACRESFTTEPTQRRLEALGDQARRQAVEEGRSQITRPWSEAPAVPAEALADELRRLAEQLREATSGDDPTRMTEALARVSAALSSLVGRARAAGITLPEPAADTRDRTES
jgi:hypothetical protein